MQCAISNFSLSFLTQNLVAHDEAGAIANDPDKLKYTEFVRFMKNVDDTEAKLQESHPAGNIWADEFSAIDSKLTTDGTSDWVKDFAESKQTGGKNCRSIFFYLKID